jgi:hypothetical protein
MNGALIYLSQHGTTFYNVVQCKSFLLYSQLFTNSRFQRLIIVELILNSPPSQKKKKISSAIRATFTTVPDLLGLPVRSSSRNSL